jgi:hypothetical protein
LSQSFHHRIAQELAGNHVIGTRCGFNATRLEQLAIAVPGGKHINLGNRRESRESLWEQAI